jgi:hypothetical protein
MAKLSAAVLAAVVASSAAFAPQQAAISQTALKATGFEEVGGVAFDPLGLAKLGNGESFDTFPGVFPNEQFLKAAEIKHGRQAMLAWTGVWATHEVSIVLRCVYSVLDLVYPSPLSVVLPKAFLLYI